MELFLHRFGGSRFRESKDRGKMPSTQLFGVQLGCNSARAGDEKGRYRTENRLPQIGKSFGAERKTFLRRMIFVYKFRLTRFCGSIGTARC